VVVGGAADPAAGEDAGDDQADEVEDGVEGGEGAGEEDDVLQSAGTGSGCAGRVLRGGG
jgi:hypothetical protein